MDIGKLTKLVIWLYSNAPGAAAKLLELWDMIQSSIPAGAGASFRGPLTPEQDAKVAALVDEIKREIAV